MKSKTSRNLKPVLLLSAVLMINLALFASEFYKIKNPKPNMDEKGAPVVYTEEVATINEDLGNDQYLFSPFSITADKSNVFVFDKSQARVYRFSPDLKMLDYFGRQGQGPSEFYGKGLTGHVSISIGRDGNLYANDAHGRRFKALDRRGKELKSFSTGDNFTIQKPVGDKHGNILYVTLKEGKLSVKNEKDVVLGECKSEKLHYGFMSDPPDKLTLQGYAREFFAPEAVWALTLDGKLLIHFTASASLAVFNPKGDGYEYVKTLKLWPREALLRFKEKYRKKKERRAKRPLRIKNARRGQFFMAMFGGIIVDQDDKDVFYLSGSIDGSKQKLAAGLYAFNLEGQLLKIVHFPVKPESEDAGYARVETKVNNIFYAVRGDSAEVVLFQEKKNPGSVLVSL